MKKYIGKQVEAGVELKYEAVVMGVSAGGMKALGAVLPSLPADFAIPVVIVQHRSADSCNYLERSLNDQCRLTVIQADDKESIKAGAIYFAPPDYHLLIEDDRTFSLSVDYPVNYVRPSIDILFETAADAYGKKIIGIILTGANSDGSQGLKTIKERGGLVVVQDPQTAEVASMPRAAIAATHVDHILPLDQIAPFFVKICSGS